MPGYAFVLVRGWRHCGQLCLKSVFGLGIGTQFGLQSAQIGGKSLGLLAVAVGIGGWFAVGLVWSRGFVGYFGLKWYGFFTKVQFSIRFTKFGHAITAFQPQVH